MKRWLLIMPVILGATPNLVLADNLWDKRDPRHANLFQDTKARNVGDLVTIVINESTTANEREQRALDKSNTISGAGAGSANLAVGPTTSYNYKLSEALRKQFTGNAQLTSGRTFQDKLTATVVDMLPNGNLVIEGYRSRVVAGEERVLRITGVVRQVDVGDGNTVQSTSIANAKISYLGKGPETRTINQNWFNRIMGRAWPW